MRMSPNTSPLEIWHHDLIMVGGDPYPYGFVKLDLTYRKYIETLVVTKGVEAGNTCSRTSPSATARSRTS
jgi:hypothetical protein